MPSASRNSRTKVASSVGASAAPLPATGAAQMSTRTRGNATTASRGRGASQARTMPAGVAAVPRRRAAIQGCRARKGSVNITCLAEGQPTPSHAWLAVEVSADDDTAPKAPSCRGDPHLLGNRGIAWEARGDRGMPSRDAPRRQPQTRIRQSSRIRATSACGVGRRHPCLTGSVGCYADRRSRS